MDEARTGMLQYVTTTQICKTEQLVCRACSRTTRANSPNKLEGGKALVEMRSATTHHESPSSRDFGCDVAVLWVCWLSMAVLCCAASAPAPRPRHSVDDMHE
eukprot:6180786-Pleurochrysis_carterae.AAC.2